MVSSRPQLGERMDPVETKAQPGKPALVAIQDIRHEVLEKAEPLSFRPTDTDTIREGVAESTGNIVGNPYGIPHMMYVALGGTRRIQLLQALIDAKEKRYDWVDAKEIEAIVYPEKAGEKGTSGNLRVLLSQVREIIQGWGRIETNRKGSGRAKLRFKYDYE